MTFSEKVDKRLTRIVPLPFINKKNNNQTRKAFGNIIFDYSAPLYDEKVPNSYINSETPYDLMDPLNRLRLKMDVAYIMRKREEATFIKAVRDKQAIIEKMRKKNGREALPKKRVSSMSTGGHSNGNSCRVTINPRAILMQEPEAKDYLEEEEMVGTTARQEQNKYSPRDNEEEEDEVSPPASRKQSFAGSSSASLSSQHSGSRRNSRRLSTMGELSNSRSKSNDSNGSHSHNRSRSEHNKDQEQDNNSKHSSGISLNSDGSKEHLASAIIQKVEETPPPTTFPAGRRRSVLKETSFELSENATISRELIMDPEKHSKMNTRRQTKSSVSSNTSYKEKDHANITSNTVAAGVSDNNDGMVKHSSRRLSRASLHGHSNTNSISRRKSHSEPPHNIHYPIKGGSLIMSYSGTFPKKEIAKVTEIKHKGRFRRVSKTIGMAAHLIKYLGQVLYNSVEWGWEYDPTANLTNEKKTISKIGKGKDKFSKEKKKKEVEESASLAVHNVAKASIRQASFNGWLTPEMRDLFRKPIWQRTDQDIKEMQRWCSSMKAFRRFTEPVQKELLKVARYDRWHLGRLIIREGHKPMFFFIILDGEVEIFGRDKDAYRFAYEVKKDEIENSSPKEKIAKLYELDRAYIKVFGSMSSGDCFGDIAFRPGGSRTASIKTKRTTEFLLVDRSDFENIMASASSSAGNTDAQKRLENFADSSELFGSIKFDKKALSRYCDVRSFAPNATILCEGEYVDFIWFIRSGTAKVMKLIHFIKEEQPSGRKTYHILPAKYQQISREGEYTFDIDEIVAFGEITLKSPKSRYFLMSKLMVLQHMGPGSHYGETNGIVANLFENLPRRQERSKAKAEEEVGNEIDWYGKNCSFPSAVSIVANSKVDIIGVSKIDFHKNSTPKTWRLLAQDRWDRWTLDEIIESYLERRKWKMYCRKQIEELIHYRQRNREVLRDQSRASK